MAELKNLRDAWLVAVWPGMGNVALLAGSYLLQQLDGAQVVEELEPDDFFEVQNVDVNNGIATLGRPPRSVFFEWRNPTGKTDLLLFLGEAQPNAGGYDLCRHIVGYAASRGVKRIVTFAAMATQLNPGETPRVFAAATDQAGLRKVRPLDVEVLKGGQISGLNGLLLAAGAEQGISGTCLLGELPFFAVGVPNPRASMAALERFSRLTGIEINLDELKEQAEAQDEHLIQMMEQVSADSPDVDVDEPEAAESEPEEVEGPPKAPDSPPRLDARSQRKIESLFARARQDRTKAMELKQELDRLGVFKTYEDRFLDLFRKAE